MLQPDRVSCVFRSRRSEYDLRLLSDVDVDILFLVPESSLVFSIWVA